MRFKDITESSQKCPHCGGPLVEYSGLMEKKDACYYKVKASAKVWPSAYASGRLVQCRKKGAANYGNKSEGVAEGLPQTLRKVVPGYAKREIDKKMDAGKFGKTDADKDANFQRYKKIQDKLKEQGVAEGAEQEILFYAKIPDGSRVYARVKDEEQWARLQQQYRGSEIKTFDFRRPDILDWLEARGINLRKFAPGMVQTMYPGSRGHPGSTGLNEFASGSGGDDEAGDDPYKYPKPKRYNRSADYFEQFEADHFDREDFDDDTGVFKGYWGSKQIAYFKFDNPARTGGNNPGMGWYYEPESVGRSDDTTAAAPPPPPAVDNADERKQQELSMIRAFLKSGNRPNPDSQIGRLMKKHGMAEDLSRRGFLRGLGAAAIGAAGVGAAGSAQARSSDASRKEDDEALALLAKGMTPEQVAKKLGVQGPNHGQTHQMGGRWASINRAAAQLQRQQQGTQGLNEFAPPSSDDGGNDGFSDDTLKRLAAQWWQGDEDPRVEQTLAAAGWEIGQDEGYDEGGVFVVQAGDVNGNSYISWPATELEGLAESLGNIKMNEKYNPEYDDEAGMADNNLQTLARAVEGIDDLIQTGDNLPEWCQEKIAVAKSMLVAVWDYMYSEEASEEVDPEIDAMFEAMDQLVHETAHAQQLSVDLVWESFESLPDHMLYETAAWRRKEGKSKKGGLNAKGVASYRRENPGSKLQMAVTTKPSKLKPGSKAAKRRKSFCARMSGVKGPMKKPNGKPTRKALALRKWNC